MEPEVPPPFYMDHLRHPPPQQQRRPYEDVIPRDLLTAAEEMRLREEVALRESIRREEEMMREELLMRSAGRGGGGGGLYDSGIGMRRSGGGASMNEALRMYVDDEGGSRGGRMDDFDHRGGGGPVFGQ